MLAARDGMGRLPNGYLAELAERTGKSRDELSKRARFATRYPSEAELHNAVLQFSSWHQVANNLKAEKDTEDNLPVEPKPVPEGNVRRHSFDHPRSIGLRQGVPLRAVK